MDAQPRDELTQVHADLSGATNESVLTALLPLVYPELRRVADAYLRGERADHTLQPTALVHEAYLRLADSDLQINDRKHFYRTAAMVMRRILVNHAIERRAQKRGGGIKALPLSEVTVAWPDQEIDLVALDEALRELIQLNEQIGRVVELRFFGGCTIAETAEILGISPKSVERHWTFARAWLRAKLEDQPHHSNES